MNDRVVILRSERGGWLSFERPIRECVAWRTDRVAAALNEASAATQAGYYVAGFVAYEAASGLDSALTAHTPTRAPLVWLGVYEKPSLLPELPSCDEPFEVGAWQPSVTPAQYRAAIGRIRDWIRAGDTYQVNYTYRLRARFRGSAWALFLALQQAQRSVHSAFVRLPNLTVCSVSPELFFSVDGERIVSRPMKGTAARGWTSEEDGARADALRHSPKERAENVMITDMIRNDLGRIARFGSVRVVRAFETEPYPTVWQMTSTVEARTTASLSETMRALFPCASVTGAPKVRAMQIVRALEPDPRGLYTGAIGYWSPAAGSEKRRAEFNVAIRTAVIGLEQPDSIEYGVGGGIVWDSDPDGEYEECLAKARVLSAPPRQPFRMLETMLWTSQAGYALLDRHLRRMADSAAYFSFPFDPETLTARLNDLAAGLDKGSWRVRVLLAENGEATVETVREPERDPNAVLRLAFSADPVDIETPFLYHKTTFRDVYERARASVPAHDDAILYNARGEVTETTVANLVFEIGGRKVTPPVRCGLLPGTFRAELVASGQVEERVVTKAEAAAADRVFAVNSVRGWMRARLEHG